MSSPNAIVTKLAQSIGGYSGYEELTERRSTDSALRYFLIQVIQKLVEKLNQSFHAENPDDQERLDLLVSSTQRKLETIRQSLDDPTYQEVLFFNQLLIPERRLGRLYDLEQDMVEETCEIQRELRVLDPDQVKREAFEDHFLQIQNFIDNINQYLFERESLIVGEE